MDRSSSPRVDQCRQNGAGHREEEQPARFVKVATTVPQGNARRDRQEEQAHDEAAVQIGPQSDYRNDPQNTRSGCDSAPSRSHTTTAQ